MKQGEGEKERYEIRRSEKGEVAEKERGQPLIKERAGEGGREEERERWR